MVAAGARVLGTALIAVLTLTSCGHGSPAAPDVSLPQVSLKSPVQNLVSFDDATALALYGANPVVPLFAIPDIDTNLGTLDVTFWGTKDAAGNILQLTEAGVSGLTSAVHIFFDTSERPIYFRDDSSGYAIKLSYDSGTQQTVTVCDPSGTAVASSQIMISGGTAQAGPAYSGGSCELAVNAAARVAHVSRIQGTAVSTNLNDLGSLAKLITAGSYVGGMAFALGAILKFKPHKDNPTQVPIGPIALMFIAAALIFIPAIFSSSGTTLFGSYSAIAPVDGLANFLAETSVLGCSTQSASCPFPNPEPTP